jgi:hypothetical protein
VSCICTIDHESITTTDNPELVTLARDLELVYDLVHEHRLLNIPETGQLVLTDRVACPQTPGFTRVGSMVIYMWPGFTTDIMIEILAHELVHLQQIHEGWLQLGDEDDENILWFGVPVEANQVYVEHGNEAAVEEYMNYPWERHARELELVVTKQIKALLTSQED